MESKIVTCSNCGRLYNQNEVTICPSCGSTDIKEDDPVNEAPATRVIATTVEVDVPPAISPYEKSLRRKKAIRAGLITILAVLLVMLLANRTYSYLSTTTHTETLTVDGFSWRTELVLEKINSNDSQVIPLEGTGKNYEWSDLPEAVSNRVVEFHSHFYVRLVGSTTQPQVFEVSKRTWDRLNFNDKVTAEINYFGKILHISVP